MRAMCLRAYCARYFNWYVPLASHRSAGGRWFRSGWLGSAEQRPYLVVSYGSSRPERRKDFAAGWDMTASLFPNTYSFRYMRSPLLVTFLARRATLQRAMHHIWVPGVRCLTRRGGGDHCHNACVG
jgi:hypothetical protein